MKQETFNDEMREFQAETLRRFENIDRRFDRMEGESSWLKNASTETMAASGALAICLAVGCQMNRFLDRNDVMAIARELTGANITAGRPGQLRLRRPDHRSG